MRAQEGGAFDLMAVSSPQRRAPRRRRQSPRLLASCRVELATYAGAGHGPLGGNGSPSFEQVAWSFLQRLPLAA
jgi:hypothetical protein